ncbi:MAG: segregation/condensation protein A [Patescibacteria group bacterium]|nr:segregation/condensation protein A [Patescibacteria group bacterium]MCX7589350.1 segregation/condensation protein A [Patescibacteria group bacterium]MDW8279713.1 segregation/condensation protein A [bacterium]
MIDYKLKVLDFEGPLDKLLELIEAKKLEINQVSLSEVTADFLKYISELNQKLGLDQIRHKEYLSVLSDFIVIASHLIFIKSKSLLNLENEEEEEQIKDLEKRLIWFKEFKPAIKNINNLWLKKYIFTHNYLWNKNLVKDIFYPGKISISLLHKALGNIFSDFQNIFYEEQKIEKTKISLEEKIKSILKFFELINETNFNELSKNYDKSELIITFLAILHLAREKLILIEQKDIFSDIIIKKYDK